jgi:hypothetical protein
MLTKPDIADELIISQLQEEYNLCVSSLTFLPLGADMGTAVYRVVADDGTAYFLKLRKGFDEISVTVPLFLKSQGIKEIIAPFETKSNQGWADFGECGCDPASGPAAGQQQRSRRARLPVGPDRTRCTPGIAGTG